MNCKLGSRIHKIYKKINKEREGERDEDRFYCARMQAEESLGVQCTCSRYIELDPRAPPSWLQSEGEEGENSWSLSYFTPCYVTANTAPPLLPLLSSRSNPQPASSFLRRLCARGGAASFTSPQLQFCTTRVMMNSVLLPPLASCGALSFTSHESSRANYPREIDGDCFAFTLFLSSFSLFRFEKFIFTSFIFRKPWYFWKKVLI